MSSLKASYDIEGDCEVRGRESCILQGQLCGEHPHSQSWLEAGIPGRGGGNHRPAPEKLVYHLSWKSGQQFGLPARSSWQRQRKVQRQWEKSLWLCQTQSSCPYPRGVWDRTPAARTTSPAPTQALSLQMSKSPLLSSLSSEASSLPFSVGSTRMTDFILQ